MTILDMYITGFNLAFRKQEITLASDDTAAENILKLHNLVLQRQPFSQRIRATKNPGFAFETGGAVDENSFSLRRDISAWPYIAPLYLHMKGAVEAGASSRGSRVQLVLEPGYGTLLAPLLILILIPLGLALALGMEKDVTAVRMLMGFFMLWFPLLYWLTWRKVIDETGLELCRLLRATVEKRRFTSLFSGA